MTKIGFAVKFVVVCFLLSFALTSHVEARDAERRRQELIQKRQELLRQRAEAQKALEQRLAAMEERDSETRRMAITSYENFLRQEGDRRSPRAADAIFQLAQLYYTEDRAKFHEAYSKYMEDLERYDRGRLKVEPTEPVKNYDRSLAFFQRLVDEYPDFPDRDVALYRLGVINEELVRPQLALKYFNELSARYPNSRFAERAYLRTGGYYYEKNRLDSALYFFEKVTMEGAGLANWGIARYRVAKTHFRMNNLEQAIRHYFEYISLADQGYFPAGGLRSVSVEELAMIYAEIEEGARRAEADIQAFHPDMVRDEAYLFFRIGVKAREYDKLENAKHAFEFLLAKYPYYPDAPTALNHIIDINTIEKRFADANENRIRLVETYSRGGRWVSAPDRDPKDVLRAESYVEQALSLIPLYFHKLGDDNRDREMYAKAIPFYEKYIEWFGHKDPFRVYEFKFYLASCYQAVGRYRDAAKTFDAIVDMDTSGFPMDRLSRLRFDRETAAYNAVLAYGGLMEGAISDFNTQFDAVEVKEYIAASERYMLLFPTGPGVDEVRMNLASVFYRGERYAQAATVYKYIVDNTPNSRFYKDAFMFLGQAYLFGGELELAETTISNFIRTFPNIAADELRRINILLGSAVFKQGERAKAAGDNVTAIRHFMRVHEVAPESEVADIGIQNAAVTYEEKGQHVKAAETFLYLQERYPRSPLAVKALLRAAENYRTDSLWDLAAQSFVKVAEEYPDSVQAITAVFVAASMFDTIGEFNRAGQHFEKVFSMFPRHERAAEGLYYAGLMYEKAENWDKAIEVYRNIERHFPESPYLTDAIYSVAITYQKQERWAEASQYFESFAERYASENPPRALVAYMEAAECEFKITPTDHDRIGELLDRALNVFERYAERFAINAYYAAKATYMKGNLYRAKMDAIELSGTNVTQNRRGETEFKKIDERSDERKTGYLTMATQYYAQVAQYMVETWTLRANNNIGFMMVDYAEKIDNQPITVNIRGSSDDRTNLEIAARIIFKEASKNIYLQAADRFVVNVDYGIANRITNAEIDTARVMYTKVGWEAGNKLIEAGVLFAESPIPSDLHPDDVEFYKEELQFKKFEMEEQAMPLFESVLRASYERYIDNQYTTKLRDRIREINSSSAVLLERVKTPEFAFVRREQEDMEYVLAVQQADALLASTVLTFEEIYAQLTSMALTARRRITEEAERVAVVSRTIEQVDARIEELTKEIFALGGGMLQEDKEALIEQQAE